MFLPTRGEEWDGEYWDFQGETRGEGMGLSMTQGVGRRGATVAQVDLVVERLAVLVLPKKEVKVVRARVWTCSA